MRPDGTLVPGTLVCSGECHKLRFVPKSPLAAHTKYTAIAKLGNAQGVATAQWSFTTGP
jgi:hypothetical protein